MNNKCRYQNLPNCFIVFTDFRPFLCCVADSKLTYSKLQNFNT